MFKFIKRADAIDMVGNGATFKNVSISVKTEDRNEYILPITEFSETEIYGVVSQAEARVKICEENGVVTLLAGGGLIRDRSKGQFYDNSNTNLNAKAAFSLTFSEIENLKSYTASNLVTFWTLVSRLGREDIKQILPDTQAIIYDSENTFGCLFATCDKQYKSAFCGSEKGLSAVLQSYKRGLTRFSSVLFFFATDTKPYALPKKITDYGLKFLGKKAAPADKKRYPEIFEYLGWCSWDAFPYCVNHQGLLDKFEEFKSKNIPVRWGIVDDSWAVVDGENGADVMHDRKLLDFKANQKQFPKGFKAALTEVKEKYGVKMGAWHPLEGYWYGFSPDGVTAKEYGKYLTQNDDVRLVVKPTAEDMFGYHNAFYGYLKESGIDFVKVDCQSSLEWFYRNMGTIGEIADAVHTGIEGAVGVHFDGTIINCMGCATEDIWNRPNSILNRCSNDFLPEDRKWFIDHILQCTYTCYFYSGLFKGDFDMFWTDDGQAVKNCLLRAISGGPVYVSDKLGRSVAERILPLVLADGRILRCNNSAVPTADCLTVDPRVSKKAYKVFNSTNNGLVAAAFNVDKEEKPVNGSLSPFELEGATADKYLSYDFFSGEAQILNKGDEISFTLNNYDDYRYYNFIPVEDGFSVIGLTDKYVTSATYEKFGENKYTVLNGGEFAFYSETKPECVYVDGKKVPFTAKNNYYLVDLGEISASHILEFEF